MKDLDLRAGTIRAPALAAGALALALLGAPAAAQSPPAGSASYVLHGAAVGSSGGSAESPNFQATAALESPVPDATSPGFGFRGGVLGLDEALAPPVPLVFGVAPGVGSKAGGEAVRVLGFGFGSPGIDTATVALGGSLAPSTVLSNLELDVTTPAGVNALGNPKGLVAVDVTTAAGSARRKAAFAYTPSLAQHSPAYLGDSVGLRYRGAPGSFVTVATGATVPGVAIPIATFEGQLVLVSATGVVVPMTPSPTGDQVLVLPLPNKPWLAGLTVRMQGLSITSLAPLAGSFTNVLPVTLEL